MTPAELETIYGIPMGVMPSPGQSHLISFAR
jgi:iron complex transport system ATP-binding protein